MSTVVMHNVVSVDGFIADANDEVGPLFNQLLDNLEICLDQDRVHGDLSAYNVLYWEGKLQIIDFPQAVDPLDNPDAFALFTRDLERIYAYFTQYGVRCGGGGAVGHASATGGEKPTGWF